jgi:hypothetical protein
LCSAERTHIRMGSRYLTASQSKSDSGGSPSPGKGLGSAAVASNMEDIALQIDGDACTEPLPARVTVAPEPVWVLAPE